MPPAPLPETPPTTQRSAIMSAIRSSRTGPEEALAKALNEFGLRPDSRNDRSLLGAPDFVFRASRLAAFVDSAFWHGKGKIPKTNRDWWAAKLARNRARDKAANAALRAAGWRVFRIDAGFCVRRPAVSAMLLRFEHMARAR